MKKETIWNEKYKRWEYKNGGRVCTIDNETIDVVLDNCKEFLEKRDRIYISDVKVLLEKALEGVENKKDLVSAEQDSIKAIRNMIKGL